MLDSDFQLEKNLVKEAFDRAAPHYDEVAVLQREVSNRMMERLDLVKIVPKHVLDIGVGTGVSCRALNKYYKKAQIIGLDLAPGMLQLARNKTGWFSKQRFVCGDAEQLPLADDSVDMIFSNLTFQWCHDLDRTFRECYRVLKPGGLLMFSTLGPDTLKELRASWLAVDDYAHVNKFIDMHDIGDAMVKVQLSDPVMDVESIIMTYPDVYKLMRDLKTLGAHNVNTGRIHGLTGKGRLKTMIESYETYRKDDQLPATYEIVYGHAWVPENKSVGHVEADGAYAIPVSSLRGSRRGAKVFK
jgi:malonyl-CoA O-methyltransferase